MHQQGDIFPQATRELSEERKRLASEPADAFRVALDTIAQRTGREMKA